MQILSYLRAPTSVLPGFHASAVRWDWGYCRKGESFLPQADSELCPYFLGIAFWTLRRVVNGEDKELLCPWLFIHPFILFNCHIRTSATYEIKMHEFWLQGPPILRAIRSLAMDSFILKVSYCYPFCIRVPNSQLSGNWLEMIGP